MLPPSSAGAALNEYSATPCSANTRTLLENGYAFGIAIDPSAIPSAPSYSTTASTWSGRGARANTRRGVPSSQFIWSKS